jgi:hypothetical protein
MNLRSALSTLVLAAALCRCSADPFAGSRVTRVNREQLVVTRRPHADLYFAAVRGCQYALGGIDRRRADLMAGLARALGRLPNAEAPDLENGLRDALRGAGVSRVRVRFERGAQGTILSQEKELAWLATVLTPTAPDERAALAAIDARYDDVVRDVPLTLTPTPAPNADAPPLGPLLAEIERVLRDAIATQRCAALLTRDLPDELADDSLARAEAPAYAAEFAAARRYVQSIRARAALHTQESARIARWLEAALTTDAGEETPDENAEPQ